MSANEISAAQRAARAWFAAGNPDRRSVQFPLSLTAEAVRA